MSKTGIYYESGWKAEVEVLEDLSDSEWEKYRLRVIRTLRKGLFGSAPDGHEFEASARRQYRHMVDWQLEIKEEPQ